MRSRRSAIPILVSSGAWAKIIGVFLLSYCQLLSAIVSSWPAQPVQLVSRIIISSRYELHRPGAQIPAAEILRGDRTRARHPHLAERARTGADGARLHLQRASRHREDDAGADSGGGPELPLLLKDRRQTGGGGLRRLRSLQ